MMNNPASEHSEASPHLSITGATAKALTERRFFVIPLCWPNAGRCACPKKHENEKEVGKAPFLGKGYPELRWTYDEVRGFWLQYPLANIGILLKPSGLFVLDADSAEADREIEAKGVPPGPRVVRADHIHRYFHNRAGIIGRVIHAGQSGKIDILTDGYVVGPGSLHRSGTRYVEEVAFDAIELDDPPRWAIDLLRAGVNGHSATEAIPEHLQPVDIDALSVPRWTKMLIRGGPAIDPTKYPSRSEAVFAVLQALMRSDITDPAVLASILLNPQFAISGKPREQGRRWLAAEIARARAKCTQDNGGSRTQGNTSSPLEADWSDVTAEQNEAPAQSTSQAMPPLPEEEVKKIAKSASKYEPSWPVLAEDALYGLAGDIVRAIDPYTEADAVAVLLNILAAFGNCINTASHARVQHDHHPARLFVVQVGDTSKGRKGTGWSTPRYLLSLCDPDWTKDRIKSGLSSGEGLIYQVRDPRYETKDGEQVCLDTGTSDKRLLVVEPEFASVLTVMEREKNTLSAIIRQAWDHGTLTPMTKNARIEATDAHVSLIGHITKQELLARLDDTSKANGFANRFLWALVRRSKELPEGGAVPEEQLQSLAEQLKVAIAFARAVSEVKRDEEARALWTAVYHDLSEGKPGLLGAVLSRAEAQVLRLSVIYALLDCSPVVRVEHLKAALAVWEYCEQSAVLIFGDRLGDPTADRILEALRNAGPQGMTANDLYELFGKHKSAQARAGGVNLLLRLGLITAEEQKTEGRSRTVYRAA